MAILRDFLDQVERDHPTEVRVKSSGTPFNPLYGNIAHVVTIRCTCGWKARRAVSEREMEERFHEVMTQAWLDNERFNHLLDQKVPDAG